MQRKREQRAILAGHDLHFDDNVELRCDIAVAQRHAFGRTGGSRRVEQHRRVVRACRREFRRRLIEKSLPTPLIIIGVSIE